LHQVGLKHWIALEGSDVLVREKWGVGVELARLRQWEEPLDEVVDGLQIVVGPSQNVLQQPSFGVGFQVTVEVHKARHGFSSSLSYCPPTACPNASRNASGGCAPDNVILPLMMKNATPPT